MDRLGARALMVMMALTLLAGGAAAQDQDRFDPHRLRPSPAFDGPGVRTLTATPVRGFAWQVGVLAHYDGASLLVRDDDDEILGAVVDGALWLHVLGEVGFAERFRLGVDLPVALWQGGDDVITTLGPVDLPGDLGPGMGDPRLVASANLFDQGGRGFSLGLAVDVSLPAGDAGAFRGDDAVRVEPRLLTELGLSRATLAADIGWRFQRDVVFANSERTDALTWAMSAAFAVDEAWAIVPELTGGVMVLADDLGAEEVPAEGLLTARWRHASGWRVLGGVAGGLVAGLGTPGFRVLLGVGFQAQPEPEPEPKPEPEPQPEPEPEPEPQPEPEPAAIDRDRDGLPDSVDRCPLDPEDRDGFEDDDGCPDRDHDRDEIPEPDDECPDEPETRNDYLDDDGCPDQPPAVEVRCESLELNDTIHFEVDKAVVLPRSYGLLDAVAQALEAHPEVEVVSIEGHTDSTHTDDYNLDLSRRRAAAVRRGLMARGVPGGRMRTAGFGESRPIATNETDEGRAKNRRVEFRIVEAAPREGCPPR